MPELNDHDISMIHETHEAVTQLRAVILGVNGNPGLIDQVNKICTSHDNLKKTVWTLIGVLSGSGVLGGTLCQLLK